MKTSIKRFVAGLAVAATLVGGMMIQTPDASAKTRVLRSDDGKLMLVCVYDDDTGELAYCDVYWLGLANAGNAGVLDPGGATGGTRLPASQLALAGNQLVVDGGQIDGAPDQQFSVNPDRGGKHTGGKGKGKHHR